MGHGGPERRKREGNGTESMAQVSGNEQGACVGLRFDVMEGQFSAVQRSVVTVSHKEEDGCEDLCRKAVQARRFVQSSPHKDLREAESIVQYLKLTCSINIIDFIAREP